jgi:hypothetical protein
MRRSLSTRRGSFVRIHGLTLDQIGWRIKNYLIAILHTVADLDRRAVIAHHGELADMNGSIFHRRDVEAVAVEEDGFGWNDQGSGLAGNLQFDLAIDSGGQRAVGIGGGTGSGVV